MKEKKVREQLFCVICGKELQGNQKMYCCNNCKAKAHYNKQKDVNLSTGNTSTSQERRGVARKLQLIKQMGGSCSSCGYNKNIAALEFHHINASDKEFSLDKRTLSNNSMDKILKEAEKCILLCANCHREEHYPESLLDVVTESVDDYIQFLNPKTLDCNYDSKNYCTCGAEIDSKAKLCKKCNAESKRLVERPTKEELLELIKTTSFVSIGKKFGVAGNTIRKWCKSYDLPFKQVDIKLLD